ncbi:disintegrin and metalloproteinase domain-containing protein 12-like isoform X2 [Hypanus sabinus]|uniref:disintegrin and metalloproteinase domain-containing protein 12-like isoform X2 n=1 Tax=Hypanus sabinus TaxID=79690 RepID=UPI0028C4BEEB|nr:disintegrin and metalloproteinase domain-containing protein 12-like isoform X2 [Hypanus sabinus]
MFASSLQLVLLLWCLGLNRSETESGESHGAEEPALRNGMLLAAPGNTTDSRSPAAVSEIRTKGATVKGTSSDQLHVQRLFEELTDYRFVFPYVLSGKRKRSLATSVQGSYPHHVSILVEFAGEQLTLDLSRNTVLLPRGFQVSHYDSNGTLVTEQDQEMTQCYYEGSVRGFSGSAVSASTCSGLSALIVLGNRTYVIEHLGEPEHERHLLYRPEDLKSVPGRCGVTNTSPVSALAQDLQHIHRMKRNILQEMKYVEMVLVADNAEYQVYGKSTKAVVKRMLDIANTIDMYYRPFNIRIALIGVEVWTQDQVTVDKKAGKMLTQFLQWRKNSLLPRLYNDNAQLVLGGIFEGGTAGLASFGSICSASHSGGVNLDIHPSILAVSATISHELGHNLGISHDSKELNCQCPDENDGCIMEDAVGFDTPSQFSSCSHDALNRILLHGGGICLYNLPKLELLVGGPVCGNMYVEEGEECDCGKPEDCNDVCCQPSTCTFTAGAECSSTGPCCKECKFLPAGTVCRPKQGECDLPEFCTGQSQDCPNNQYVKDGHTCSEGNLYCSQGTCQSVDQQCQDIWGPGAKSAEKLCYEVTNEQGNKYGNCGQDENNNYIACQSKDVQCGKIQCNGGNATPLRGGSITTVTSSLVYKGVKYSCRAIFATLGDANSDDLVHQGTRCGTSKACLDGKCQNVAMFDVEGCDRTCNNRGICNNNNNCFCNDGWAPPYCNSSGIGGSVDSGPVKDVQKVFTAEPETTTTTTRTTTTTTRTTTEIHQKYKESPAKHSLTTVLLAVLVPLAVLIPIVFTIVWVLKKKRMIFKRTSATAPCAPAGAARSSESTFVFVPDTQSIQNQRPHLAGHAGIQISPPSANL